MKMHHDLNLDKLRLVLEWVKGMNLRIIPLSPFDDHFSKRLCLQSLGFEPNPENLSTSLLYFSFSDMINMTLTDDIYAS